MCVADRRRKKLRNISFYVFANDCLHYIHVSSLQAHTHTSHLFTECCQQWKCLICGKPFSAGRKKKPGTCSLITHPLISQLRTEPKPNGRIKILLIYNRTEEGTPLSLSVPLETNQPEWDGCYDKTRQDRGCWCIRRQAELGLSPADRLVFASWRDTCNVAA